mmetsp:Transcript_52002/g.70978  ORF Transcript_52002/g.70978 Transcript_52002/m.70978 type:complete len:208 (+) Transcript_52002:2087-2710(+)
MAADEGLPVLLHLLNDVIELHRRDTIRRGGEDEFGVGSLRVDHGALTEAFLGRLFLILLGAGHLFDGLRLSLQGVLLRLEFLVVGRVLLLLRVLKRSQQLAKEFEAFEGIELEAEGGEERRFLAREGKIKEGAFRVDRARNEPREDGLDLGPEGLLLDQRLEAPFECLLVRFGLLERDLRDGGICHFSVFELAEENLGLEIFNLFHG